MGYKKYRDISMAYEMVDKIRRGEISSRTTAYSELTIIIDEWKGTNVADLAEDLADERYADLRSKNYFK